MSERLVVAIIADTTFPDMAARLLGDIRKLADLDPGFASIDVLVLENPSSEPDPGATLALSVAGPRLHLISRSSQERDIEHGRFGRLRIEPGRWPIATARTLVQRHAFDHVRGTGASVWIVDEDLRLSPSFEAMARGEPSLSERIRRLRDRGVDVAIGPVLGAPPLPARSTVRVNLEDLRRHLDVVAELEPKAPWPDWSAENARVRRAFPEYYYDLTRAHEDAGAHAMWIERAHPGEPVHAAFARLAEAVGGLLDGIPSTRALPERPLLDSGPALLARGGNTLVLRASLLDTIPNVAPRLGGRVCRRSDMLWARLCATLEGARFAFAPILTFQDRSGPGRSSFDFDKLLDDVRGSALVSTLDDLIEHGALPGRAPLPESKLARALRVYVTRVQERLDAIHGSEVRVRALLDDATGVLRERPGFLRHPSHAATVERLLEQLTSLRAAYESPIEPFVPFVELADVEQFFQGLDEEIRAFGARQGHARDVTGTSQLPSSSRLPPR
ncbi:hypothetical protein [Polyangium sp. 6x1]|uniref:hypothetical protein n=1 Tax=Polyangium sp. 6x1 TaxID=3042689 RepID=UPI002482954B|nr:hypothetical protein [Polyangium sp. 6x1]MDI1443599.1 hypothetical protein [Polyangium sp. 6x1]